MSDGRLIALIPARSGSKRVPHKNIRILAGHPLIAYTIQVAKDSGLFGEHIYVSSDSEEYLEIAQKYGAKKLYRPAHAAQDTSPDSEWIESALGTLSILGHKDIEQFMLLRPTNPFRSASNLIDCLHLVGNAPILKSVRVSQERPEKMWHMVFDSIVGAPLMLYPYIGGGLHYKQTSSFSPLYTQSGAIEIRKAKQPMPIDGPVVAYLNDGYEGFDINTEEDWILAEALIERGLAKLPEIK